MKKNINKFALLIAVVCFSISLQAQTLGFLTFTFTPVTKAPCYAGSRNVLAIWIQTNSFSFVKTKLRNAGASTADHLPSWAANSGGSSANCMSAACNVVDATTGATLASFTPKTIVWDGKDAAGTLVPDGVYMVSIQETWNHGSGSTALTSYTFTKGPVIDSQTLPGDAVFSNIQLDWIPSMTGIAKSASINPEITIYPNPTSGIFNISYSKANSIKVLNTLGSIVYEEKINQSTERKTSVNLTNFANGIYIINVSNNDGYLNYKVVLNK